jgi:hypothetical protein
MWDPLVVDGLVAFVAAFVGAYVGYRLSERATEKRQRKQSEFVAGVAATLVDAQLGLYVEWAKALPAVKELYTDPLNQLSTSELPQTVLSLHDLAHEIFGLPERDREDAWVAETVAMGLTKAANLARHRARQLIPNDWEVEFGESGPKKVPPSEDAEFLRYLDQVLVWREKLLEETPALLERLDKLSSVFKRKG